MFDYEAQREHFGPLSGGRLCLDFANTVGGRTGEEPEEAILTYGWLIAWCEYVQVVTPAQAEVLLQEAARCPQWAEQIRERAIGLREAIYHIFSAVADQDQPRPADLAVVNQVLAEALAHLQIRPQENGFDWAWTDIEGREGWILWPIVRSAAELLTSDDLERVGVCAAPTCGWLFLDTSRNRSRRWCEMKSCGNRAKARRYYRRQHAS